MQCGTFFHIQKPQNAKIDRWSHQHNCQVLLSMAFCTLVYFLSSNTGLEFRHERGGFGEVNLASFPYYIKLTCLNVHLLLAGHMTRILNYLVQVNSQTCDTVATGIQLGFLGCLSTVSTFIAEFNAMRESKHPWRANAYALITIFISFGLGILIYSVPVWTKGYG